MLSDNEITSTRDARVLAGNPHDCLYGWIAELKPGDLVIVQYRGRESEVHCVLRVMKRFIETQRLGRSKDNPQKWSHNGHRYGSGGVSFYSGPILQPHTDAAAAKIARQQAWNIIRYVARANSVDDVTAEDLARLVRAIERVTVEVRP